MESLTEIKIRGYHLDFYGHVNNARYLEFLEEGRWDYYGEEITSNFFTKNKFSFVVVNININYRKPAFLNQTLAIKTEVKKIGTKSVTLLQQVFIKGKDALVADADITYVIIDSKGKPLPMEGELKKIMVK